MANSLYPSQFGYKPTGVNGTAQQSTVYIGYNMSGNYGGVGFGQNGHPDYAELVQINICQQVAGIVEQHGTITLNINDILAAMALRVQFPLNLNLTLKEVLVCENNVTKGMIIIGSQTYPTGVV